MDGFTQHQLDEQFTYEQAFEATWQRCIDEGCSDQEAELIAEREALRRIGVQ